MSDFSIGNSNTVDISRSFNEAMDIYLTTLYDREFGSWQRYTLLPGRLRLTGLWKMYSGAQK